MLGPATIGQQCADAGHALHAMLNRTNLVVCCLSAAAQPGTGEAGGREGVPPGSVPSSHRKFNGRFQLGYGWDRFKPGSEDKSDLRQTSIN